MDDLEALKAEVCRLLDSHNFWQAIQIIQAAMMHGDFYSCEEDIDDGPHGLLEDY